MKRKILGICMAFVMSASILPQTMVSAADDSSPKVLFFRDYEDYTGGAKFFVNNTTDCKYGAATATSYTTWPFATTATKGVGANGNCVQFNETKDYLSSTFTMPETYTTGKFYLGFDVEKKSDAELDTIAGVEGGFTESTTTTTQTETVVAEEGEVSDTYVDTVTDPATGSVTKTTTEVVVEDGMATITTTVEKTVRKPIKYENFFAFSDGTTTKYMRFGASHSAVANGTNPWNEIVSPIENLESGNQRIELLIDLDTDAVEMYANGERTGTGVMAFGLKSITFDIKPGVKYIDNFTMIHYPSSADEQTFSISSNGIDFDNNALKAVFKSDIKTTVTLADASEQTCAASYGVTFDENENIADYIEVYDNEGNLYDISHVEKGDATGEYKIVLEDEIIAGKTYNVGAVLDDTLVLKAVDGSVLNTVMTAEFSSEVPGILFYRDYEDYTDNAGILNSGSKYGTWGYQGGGTSGIKSVSGSDGKAISIKGLAQECWGRGMFPSKLTSGKFYISFDIKKSAASELTGKEYINIYWVDGGWTDNQRYQTVKMSDLPEGYNKLEYIIDLDNGTKTYYLNGEEKSSSAHSYGISGISFQFLNGGGIDVFDNFTMVHYPKSVAPQTFSVAVNDYSKKANTISVGFKSDTATDSFIAPYNVTLINELTAEDFAVSNSSGAVNVNSVAKNDTGYTLTLSELVEGETYTVALTGTDYTDILGAKLNDSAQVTIPKTVIYDFTMDEYTGGAFFDKVLTGWTGYMKAKVDDKWGTGVDFELTPGETWPLTSLSTKDAEFGGTVNSGKFVISFDYMSDEDSTGGQFVTAINSTKTGHVDNTGNMYLIYINNGNFGVPTASNSWSRVTTYTREHNKMYHIDLVMDYDNNQYMSYINGEAYAGYALSSSIGGTEVAKLSYDIGTATSFMDNVKAAYMEEGSFVIQSAERKDGAINLLLSEGAGADEHDITTADVVVKEKGTDNTVALTSVEVLGRRVMLTGAFDSSKEYTITLPSDFSNIIATELEENSIDVPAKAFKITGVKFTSDMNGTELDKSALVNGQKVYVEVKYQNTLGSDKTFAVAGSAYNTGRMTDVDLVTFTALGSTEDEQTVYVEIDAINTSGLTLKGMVLDSVATIKPIMSIE